MKLLDFSNWQVQMINKTKKKDIVDCPNCEGCGEVEERCDECSHMSEKECDLCKGAGFVAFGELSDLQQQQCFNHKEYQCAAKQDLRKMSHWTGTPLALVCIDFGYKVFSSLMDRKETIVQV